MNVAVFKYLATESGPRITGEGECLNPEIIESEINDFCSDLDVVDIKVNTIPWKSVHDGTSGVTLVYTILYK